MLLTDVIQFVDGTADPAYAVDGSGCIAAWNAAAEEEFGVRAKECLSQPCHQVIRGVDEDGTVCREDCIVKRSVNSGTKVRNYDLQIRTPECRRWFSISIVVVRGRAGNPYIIHIARQTDVPKRLEMVVRDFLVDSAGVPEATALALISSNRSARRETYLTNRELEVLRFAANGHNTTAIAKELGISPTTVDNHLQHILKKLNVHSRLKAVLLAEHSGLI